MPKVRFRTPDPRLSNNREHMLATDHVATMIICMTGWLVLLYAVLVIINCVPVLVIIPPDSIKEIFACVCYIPVVHFLQLISAV